MSKRKQNTLDRGHGAKPLPGGAAATPEQPATQLLPVWARVALSIVLTIHVVAIFTGPWAVFRPRVPAGQPRPDQLLLAGDFGNALDPYIQIAGLGNGYRFFAPQPGPSHLIRYEIDTKEGTTIKGDFPNRNENKPRLLYHRYFMLTEFVESVWNAPNELRVKVGNSYAAHLAKEYDAREVRLYHRRHNIPPIHEVRAGRSLLDPALYEEELMTVYRGDSP